jgi:tRNA-dependent cyclodipeptide synthase
MATSPERAVLFVSVGARRAPSEVISAACDRAIRDMSDLTFCLLDEPEVSNLMCLEGLSREAAARRIAAFADNFVSLIPRLDRLSVHVTTWKDYQSDNRLQRVQSTVFTSFADDRHFRNHILNQTFSNLQPRLAELGVYRKTDPLVVTLSQYLCKELALKLYFSQAHLSDVEYGLVPDMTVVVAVYKGKYGILNDVGNHRIPYIQL